jgi:hypothetical protein
MRFAAWKRCVRLAICYIFWLLGGTRDTPGDVPTTIERAHSSGCIQASRHRIIDTPQPAGLSYLCMYAFSMHLHDGHIVPFSVILVENQDP